MSAPEVIEGAPIQPSPAAHAGETARRGAAFFDLDKTLMQGSSAFQFAVAARAAHLITRTQLIGDALANLKFRLRGATDEETSKLRDRLAASLEGHRVRDFERLGLPVLIRVLPRIYPQMLEIAYAHQDAGRDVYIITAAGEELAHALAIVLTFDGGIGSHFSDQVDGHYTGRSDGPFVYGEQKATEIRRLAAEHGYDLSQSYAYSDSASDVPMPTAVGHPVVVSPDKALAVLAKEHGWQTLALDPLGRRLKVIAGLIVSLSLAGATRALWPLIVRLGLGPRARQALQAATDRSQSEQLLGRLAPSRPVAVRRSAPGRR